MKAPDKAFFLIITLTVIALMSFAGYVICPKCGWEIPETEDMCTHCGAKLPSAEDKEPLKEEKELPVSVDKADEAEDADEISEALAEDFKLGKRQFEKGNPFAAELFIRNGMALNSLSTSQGVMERGKRFLAALESCHHQIRFTETSCPVCKGTGKRIVVGPALGGSSIRASTTMPCSHCGGDGKIQGFRSVNEIKFGKGRALSAFERRQRSRKRVRIGHVWVPEKMEKGLSLEERVKLKQAWPEACNKCAGLGKTQCSDCNGRGLVRCSNSNCKDGYLEKKSSGKLGSGARLRVPCPKCKGLGFEKCSECRGRGSVMCEECEGTGKKPLCNRCDGTGLRECPRCDGTGKYKGETCSKCDGGGKVECSSCHGYGRK